jgi:uncharacterized integral membrane protein (TIGR00698 family)
LTTLQTDQSPPSSRPTSYIPGVALAALIAAFSLSIKILQLPLLANLSPLMWAVVLGMLVRNTIGRPETARRGLGLCLRAPLRTGIVLLGLQVTLAEILGVGTFGLLTLVCALAATFWATRTIGRRLGVAPGLATLIAAGTSVCGASAIVAANTVVGEDDEAVAYSLATVTLFGTVAMFLYPVIGALLPLDDAAYGLWIGGSVHEVAQVVAAGFAHGQTSGEAATVAKLARVLMLAPLVLAMGYAARDPERRSRAPMPWFVFGFLGMAIFAGTGLVSAEWRSGANFLTQGLLALALAAVGLETDLGKLVAQGWRPLALGACATLFIGAGTLAAALLWPH